MSNRFSLTLPSLSFKVANPSSFSFTDVKRTPFFSIPRRIRWSVFWTSRKVNVMNVMKHKKETASITSTASSLIIPPQLLAWEVRSTHDCWRAYQSSAFHILVRPWPGRARDPNRWKASLSRTLPAVAQLQQVLIEHLWCLGHRPTTDKMTTPQVIRHGSMSRKACVIHIRAVTLAQMTRNAPNGTAGGGSACCGLLGGGGRLRGFRRLRLLPHPRSWLFRP